MSVIACFDSDLRFALKCATVLRDESSKHSGGGDAGRRGTFCLAQSLVGLARKSESLLRDLGGCRARQDCWSRRFRQRVVAGSPESGASEIREEHNVSTNQGRATFRYTPVFAGTLERSCSPLAPDAPINSPFWRWPSFLHKGDTAAKLRSRNVRVFKCGDFTFAMNDEQQSGFFWH